MHTVILTASNDKNLALSERLSSLLTNQSLDNQIINLVDANLPLYTLEAERELGEAINPASDIYRIIDNAKSIVIVSPEYNYTMPPVLSSALCWITRVNHDFRACFRNKPVVIASHSYSGSNHLITAIRSALMGLGSVVIGQSLVSTPNQALSDDDIQSVIQTLSQLINHD